MIGDKQNFSDDFFRSLTVGILDTLEGEIYWTYRFSSGDKEVVVPFYYSMTGEEKFLLDTFVDDIVSDNRKTELNTDVIPRGVLTYLGHDILTDEIANPNVWIRMSIEDKDEIKKIMVKLKPMPVSVKYELFITLNSENDMFKCSAALMDTIGIYRYFAFQFNQMNITAVMQLPDSNQFEIVRQKDMASKNEIMIKVNFEVKTYYPAYRRPRSLSLRANDPNDNWSDSYTYDGFKKDDPNIIINPKRTKWYSNIFKSTGNPDSKGSIDSTNGDGV